MAGFHVHRSNRTERLFAELADLLQKPQGTAFDPDRVIVQGRGMGIWLSGQLARRFEVWAAPVSYPRAFMQELASSVLGQDLLGNAPESEDLLAWAVLAALPELENRPEFAALRRYREGDTELTRSAELAQQIATVFDQYLTYRPEWIAAWERGQYEDIPQSEHWQPLLWRAVARRLGREGGAPWHLAGALGRLQEHLQQTEKPVGLPPRVLLFGLSTLPPLYVRVLAQCSRHIDVHCFCFSPSPDVWRAASWQPEGAREGALDDNPLLASLGALGADFDRVLEEALGAAGVTAQLHEAHEEPRGESLLCAVQHDLFSQRARSQPSRTVALPRAGSEARLGPEISVHSCHGPMREVEVLHDRLLELLTRAQGRVQPEEVIVLVPDLHEYAPLIEAVFARDSTDEQFIPHQIADLSERHGASLIEGVLAVLGMVRGRARASEVLDLLLLEPCARRWQLMPQDLERLRSWVQDSGVRWGIDAAHRSSLDLPADDANTWHFGLQRLLLGYALPGNGERLYEGALGYDEIEGKQAELLGTLAGFTRELFAWLDRLQEAHPVAEWAALLPQLASELFAVDGDTAGQLTRVTRLLEQARRDVQAAGFADPVDVQVMRRLLERGLDASGNERGFVAGGVTFCAMVPMRSIPFRVVALLGMNDGSFPRSPRPLEFDLIQFAGERRAGDRSRRDDDRYLFLETLCAARERLIVTYSGQSVQDDRQKPPSVCVAEVLDYVEQHFTAGSAAAPPAVLLKHHLQAFNPDYFSEQTAPVWFSYAPLYAEAARGTLQARQRRRFLSRPINAPPLEQLSLAELIRFFKSPPAYFLNRRLGLYLHTDDSHIDDREPLEPDALERWKLGAATVEYLLSGKTLGQVETLLRAEGALPAGHAGSLLLEDLAQRCEAIADWTRRARRGQPQVQLDLALTIGGVRLGGAVDQLWQPGRVVTVYSHLKPKRLLEAWLHHLALCGVHGEGQFSVLIGRGEGDALVDAQQFQPLAGETALHHLETLVELYREGQSRPLPFTAGTSSRYFDRHTEPERGLQGAIAEYGDPDKGECLYDPHPARVFDGQLPPFDAAHDAGQVNITETEFHRIAVSVYEPLRANLTPFTGGAQ